MNQPHWIDIPVVDAFEYFQGTLYYFLNFARKYGIFFGTIGLMWSAFRLVNSRIDVKSMWWDTFYKFFVFILLLNIYAPVTGMIAGVANKIGIAAGDGKSAVERNLLALRNKLDENLNIQRGYADGANEIVSGKLGVQIEPQRPNETVQQYIRRIESEAGSLPRADRRAVQQELDEYRASLPKEESSMWGERTLQALDSVLIIRTPDGEEAGDLTNAYATLDIWLPDRYGRNTNYLSCGAIVRIACLSAQVLWEKNQLQLAAYSARDEDEFVDENGEKKGWIGRMVDITVTNLVGMILAGILCLVMICAGIFCAIQYSMCTIEFIIIQGMGAFFIPFYLFDGTKELPKKLVPVFTGFLVKMLVMSVCLMFVLNLFLSQAADQINPNSGGMNWVTFAQVLFSSVLAFILTSNAPKIAMTLLTGQPQLSMGEFVQAAGALAAGAVGARNAAAFAVSPAAAGAAYTARMHGERSAAGKTAALQAEKKIRAGATEGMDTSTKEGRKAEAQKWKEYKKEHGEEIAGQKKAASAQAAEKTREMQKENYIRHGGAAGTAGRVFAHYTGGVTHPVQTLKSGRRYVSPQDGSYNRADGTDSLQQAQTASVRDEQSQEKNSDEKNGLPDNLTGGRRQSSGT